MHWAVVMFFVSFSPRLVSSRLHLCRLLTTRLPCVYDFHRLRFCSECEMQFRLLYEYYVEAVST